MLNKSKMKDYFDVGTVTKPIHIIGCGSVGSHLAELFARQGATELHLWDFDIVNEHNLTNQMFFQSDVLLPKTEALTNLVHNINKDVNVITHNEGIKEPYTLSGYIFLCVDNIELRKAIVKANMANPMVVAFYDFRTRLTDAQHYAALRTNIQQMKNLLASMDFTHDEVVEHTPVSACGVEMNVVDVIKVITSIGFANFRNTVLSGNKSIKTFALIDMQSLLFDVT